MPIAGQAMEELERLEQDIRQRQNGVRVLRQLRELFFLDGKLVSGLPQASEFPLLSFALVAAVAVPALVLMILSSTQSESAPSLAQPVVAPVSDTSGTR